MSANENTHHKLTATMADANGGPDATFTVETDSCQLWRELTNLIGSFATLIRAEVDCHDGTDVQEMPAELLEQLRQDIAIRTAFVADLRARQEMGDIDNVIAQLLG